MKQLTAQQENKTHLCLKHLEEDSPLKGQNFDPFSVMNHGLCDVASQNSPHLLIRKEASVWGCPKEHFHLVLLSARNLQLFTSL